MRVEMGTRFCQGPHPQLGSFARVCLLFIFSPHCGLLLLLCFDLRHDPVTQLSLWTMSFLLWSNCLTLDPVAERLVCCTVLNHLHFCVEKMLPCCGDVRSLFDDQLMASSLWTKHFHHGQARSHWSPFHWAVSKESPQLHQLGEVQVVVADLLERYPGDTDSA